MSDTEGVWPVCTCCRKPKPEVEFAKDSRRKSGRRAICKVCQRQQERARHATKKKSEPKSGALVLVPRFPEPPPPADEPQEPGPPAHGPMRAEIEKTIAALQPPAGDADAAVVAQLRDSADLYDMYRLGLDRVRDCSTLQSKMIAALRELRATRATAPIQQTKPVSRLGRFGASSSA